VTGRIRLIEKSNGLTGNRTRDLPACGIVPQPSMLPRPVLVFICNLGAQLRVVCDVTTSWELLTLSLLIMR
jgi:hypothetical protein